MSVQLPTRLFHIPGKKLVQGKDLPQDTEYYALTHVWGPNPPSIDFPPIPWKVPAAKAKVDFILNACATNKFDYIWLDIFCIHQGTDKAAKEDQAREMPKMQQYYTKCVAGFVVGDAYETFAARWLKVGTLVNTWKNDPSGAKPETLYDIWQGLGDIDTIISDQWFWRLWTLQETVLPPQLFTSTCTVMKVYDFCDLIDWTYTALAKKILDKNGPALYDWIHPGAGVVNDNGWWMLSRSLLLTQSLVQLLGHNLDPLQALVVTAYRKFNPNYPKDTLFAAYGLLDAKWHVKDKPEYKFQDVWKLTVKKYIDNHDIAPLLSMAVTTGDSMTWAAGRTEHMGSVVTKAGQWTNKTAKMVDSKLQLSVPGVSKVELVPNYTAPYGDGSGELFKLLGHLKDLKGAKYNISSITALLIRAIHQAGFDCPENDTLEVVTDIIKNHGIAQANAISSGLRAVFNGWDRFMVTTDNKEVFLAWFPIKKDQLVGGKYSLLWSVPGTNEWTAIVEGELNSLKKLGIAFTNNFKPSSSASQEVTLL